MKEFANHPEDRGEEDLATVHGENESIRVHRLEDRLQPRVPFPHRHSFIHVVFITTGSGWHEIDFRRHRVSPSSLFVMLPGQVHSWHLDRNVRGYVLEFESRFAQSLPFAELPEYQAPTAFDRKRRERMLQLLESMRIEAEGRLPDFEAILQAYLQVFLIEAARGGRGSTPRESNARDDLLSAFTRLIEEKFTQEHRVAFYAKQLRVTPKALTMRAARSFGKSARALIQERALLEAKRLLALSPLNISQVGFRTGFGDSNYFARYFKKETGLSPSEFRQAAQNQERTERGA